MGELDPGTTLVVVASKTFTTAETLANMQAALAWLAEAGVADPEGRLIAVTARPDTTAVVNTVAVTRARATVAIMPVLAAAAYDQRG